MKDLNYYKEKIKQKRSNTPLKNVLKDIASWRVFTFYKQNWLITKYPKTERSPKIVSYKEMQENRDNLTKLWLDYDFSKTFFENYEKLYKIIDFSAISFTSSNENSEFSDSVFWAKNAYLSFVIWLQAENVLYSNFCYSNVSNILNSMLVTNNSENIFNSFFIDKSFKVFYSRYIFNSNNIWFSSNLIWCSECINCDNLENQKYCIDNKKLDKNDYFKQKEEILKNKKDFEKKYKKVNNKSNNYWSENFSWNAVYNSIDVENVYFFNRLKNSRNVMIWDWWDLSENFFDVIDAWVNAKDFYWVLWAWYSSNLYSCIEIWDWNNLFYCYTMDNCSYCIWCIWLKNKSYCILNKQYTKEEWEKIALKIFESMEADWTLWKFFPAKLNPFYFNDTVAGLIWGFKKEEIVKEWFMWRDEKIKVDIPDESLVISVDELDKYEWFDKSWNWRINPEILKKVIKTNSWDYYRIVKMEYDFLVKHSLPLPRLHWLERMKVNFGV